MKWVVIQTNLAQCPEEPIIKKIEASGMAELMEYLRDEERNDMNITAVPLLRLLVALKKCETETVE